MNKNNNTGDRDIEKFIGMQLRVSVLLACFIVLAGGVLYLAQSGSLPLPHYQLFLGQEGGLTTIGKILHAVMSIEAKGIIQLGVVLLIATPILRIFFSLIGFILEKDRLYTGITLLVLCIILFSIFGGLKV